MARYLSLLLFQYRLKPKIAHRTQGGGSEFEVLCKGKSCALGHLSEGSEFQLRKLTPARIDDVFQ